MRYRTNDGEPLTGDTPREIIEALRKLSHNPEDTLPTFMAVMRERVLTQAGYHLSTDTGTAFIAGLVAAGLLIPDEG